MRQQADNDVVLRIGDFHFGTGRTRIRTMLGSCVSITMWHPHMRIGGMCHFLLPRRGTTRVSLQASEGSYAEGVIQLFLRELRRTRTRPDEYIVKLFGGGSMFRNERTDSVIDTENFEVGLKVAEQNVRIARELLAMHGFTIAAEQVGGFGSRMLIFEVWSGDVWLRRGGALGTQSTGTAA